MNSRPPRSPGRAEAHEAFAGEFAGIDFEELGFLPEMSKERFLRALWRISDFESRCFSFERLCSKIAALLRKDSRSDRMMTVIHYWIYHAILDLTSHDERPVDGDVLGTAGEISGIYEIMFKRKTTLAGIKLGKFANIQLAVFDKDDAAIKVFDAVGANERNEIVSVFEFKFTLTLRKLYEQVIGMDSAKLPHLLVLTQHERFQHVRNLVYFGEVGEEHLMEAICLYIGRRPMHARDTKLTDKGFSIKLSLPEVSEFLCNGKTIALAQELGRPFVDRDVHPHEFADKMDYMKEIIGAKIRQQKEKGDLKFDIIVAVSNAPEGHLEAIRQAVLDARHIA